jgi:hypothetical protein
MNRHNLLLACCAALLLLPPSPGQSGPGKQIATPITANGLKADVSFLASDAMKGRGTPSPEQEIAAEFIAAQFRRAGLEPVGDDGYFQTARYVRVTPVVEGLELTVETGGQTLKMDKSAFAIQNPAAMDWKGAAVKSTQDQVSMQALTAEQVKGKVLFLLPAAEEPGGAAGGLRMAGTVGVSPAMLAELQPALVVLVRATGNQAMNTAARMREVSAAAPTPAMTLWDAKIRAALEAAPNGAVGGSVSIHIPAPKPEQVKLRNVAGVLRGSDPALKETFVLLTAHYDHLGMHEGEADAIYNGANDNASGTACVIAVANALAALPARPKRTLVFIALFGEESGLVGSRYYGQHPIFPLAKTVADLNLEQMGRTDETSGPRVGQMNATGFDFTDLTVTLGKAGEEFGVKLVKDEKNSDSFFSRSDNQAFADAGVPSHTLSVTYMFPDYHKAGDEWPKLDYDNMAKVAQTVALGVFTVADSAEAPKWNAQNAKTARYVKAHEALVGTQAK